MTKAALFHERRTFGMRIEIRTFDGEATDSLTGYAARQFYIALRPFVGHVRVSTPGEAALTRCAALKW